MIRCKTCCMPATRPDTPFVDGECQACINYRNRKNIDWDGRKKELEALLDRHDRRVIVPSSGGKDSHFQVLKLLEYGCDVTIVTARTCHLTPIGRQNIDNLARYARTIEIVPNMTVRAKLNRLGLEMVGDISWPEHASIFTTPLRVAADLGISLVMYGECPQQEYGGPQGSEEAKQMTRRWVTEFGGFLGLRPSDFVGIEGITARDMADYELPKGLEDKGIEAHFLGQYLPWDSHHNAEVAKAHGMRTLPLPPAPSNWWFAENLDNAQCGLHDYFGYLKYGYGRGCAQISIDVRAGRISRGAAMNWVTHNDGKYPAVYAGVRDEYILSRIGLDQWRIDELIEKFKC